MTEYKNARRSKSLIKESFLALMKEKPVERISICDIVRKAGLNRGTFYAHYQTPFDILREMEEEYGKTRSPLLSLMLSEPDITAAELQRIKVPVLVIAGENDLVRRSDTEYIARSIRTSKLLILKGEDHSSYIWHSAEIADIAIREMGFLCNEA